MPCGGLASEDTRSREGRRLSVEAPRSSWEAVDVSADDIAASRYELSAKREFKVPLSLRIVSTVSTAFLVDSVQDMAGGHSAFEERDEEARTPYGH